jgi:hypothetical protein
LVRLPGDEEWRITSLELAPIVRTAAGELARDSALASWFRGEMPVLESQTILPAHWAEMRFNSPAEAVSFAETEIAALG